MLAELVCAIRDELSGYGYSQLTAFIRGREATAPRAFASLKFELGGEAFQFDWSEECMVTHDENCQA